MAELAVVSLSGGLDSCVAAAEARAAGFDLALLHADYGQRTEARERRAFHEIADFYGVPASRRLVLELVEQLIPICIRGAADQLYLQAGRLG
ncbi:MAG TPA: 7-cyano-7-deazaguanine synthase, partial [Holophaga sp.]|nr:7-cyano-7-deazaguanine synthase [Holophaga sp.]